MATSAWNAFNDFTEQYTKGVHVFGTNTFKVALTNTAPSATQTTWNLTDHPAPAAANGYTAGGTATTTAVSETSGTTTVTGTQVVFTASGGNLGPFRYAVLYNDSATSPSKAAVAWFDYGSSLTLGDTETLTVKFNNASPGTMFTLAKAP
jgi:hypothetical protein